MALKTFQRSNGSFFTGKSRSEKRADNVLGVIHSGVQKEICRSQKLLEIDKYLYGTQYDGKREWDKSIPLKDRKPKIIFPFAKLYSERISSKLVGSSTFPKLQVENDPDTTYFINELLIKGLFLRPKFLDLAKDLVIRTSAFMRFSVVDGNVRVEKFNSNYCYPTFDDAEELESLEVKYIYGSGEYDNSGNEIKRWYRLELTKTADIIYDNPEYSPGAEPEFKVVDRVEHNLGFVQGEWFKFGDNIHGPDGQENPVLFEIKGLIDAINYNLSQMDDASSYGMEPQLAISGMTEDEVDDLIKSSSKAWLLGREGQAQFLEIAGSGIETGNKTREAFDKKAQDIARMVILDPEKFSATAQSGKAMEVLHGPMVELINEIRPWMQKGMSSFLQKIMTVLVGLNLQGLETMFQMPENWMPASMDISFSWPPVFELTTQDKQQIVSLALQASNANVISRDTALRWIQSQGVDFGVEDFDLEQQKVNSQQQFNTFF